MSFEEAQSIIGACLEMSKDLPDGMASEVDEAWESYLVSGNQEMLTEDIAQICQEWGFSVA